MWSWRGVFMWVSLWCLCCEDWIWLWIPALSSSGCAGDHHLDGVWLEPAQAVMWDLLSAQWPSHRAGAAPELLEQMPWALGWRVGSVPWRCMYVFPSPCTGACAFRGLMHHLCRRLTCSPRSCFFPLWSCHVWCKVVALKTLEHVLG